MTATLERESLLTGEELEAETPVRWTRAAFIQASNLGILGEGRFELLGGEVFKKMTMGGPHISALYFVQRELMRVFEPQNAVFSQVPFAFNEDDLPEPDLAVLAGTIYEQPELPATSALLIVEIADSTLWRDRKRKAPLYAQAGISDYWILNLNERILEVYRQPAALGTNRFGYRQSFQYIEGDTLSPLARPESPIEVSALLPIQTA